MLPSFFQLFKFLGYHRLTSTTSTSSAGSSNFQISKFSNKKLAILYPISPFYVDKYTNEMSPSCLWTILNVFFLLSRFFKIPCLPFWTIVMVDICLLMIKSSKYIYADRIKIRRLRKFASQDQIYLWFMEVMHNFAGYQTQMKDLNTLSLFII